MFFWTIHANSKYTLSSQTSLHLQHSDSVQQAFSSRPDLSQCLLLYQDSTGHRIVQFSAHQVKRYPYLKSRILLVMGTADHHPALPYYYGPNATDTTQDCSTSHPPQHGCQLSDPPRRWLTTPHTVTSFRSSVPFHRRLRAYNYETSLPLSTSPTSPTADPILRRIINTSFYSTLYFAEWAAHSSQ